MSLNVQPVLDDLVSLMLTLGRFEHVQTNEPKNQPGAGLNVGIWGTSIRPNPKRSGLNKTSVIFTVNCRIYSGLIQFPQDEIDPDLMLATQDVLNALHGSFSLSGDVAAIDLLGMSGVPLAAEYGYLTLAGKMYRVCDITIPVLIDDVWQMVA